MGRLGGVLPANDQATSINVRIPIMSMRIKMVAVDLKFYSNLNTVFQRVAVRKTWRTVKLVDDKIIIQIGDKHPKKDQKLTFQNRRMRKTLHTKHHLNPSRLR